MDVMIETGHHFKKNNRKSTAESAKKNVPYYLALGMLQIYLHHLKTLKIMSNLIKICYVEVVKKNNSDRLKIENYVHH